MSSIKVISKCLKHTQIMGTTLTHHENEIVALSILKLHGAIHNYALTGKSHKHIAKQKISETKIPLQYDSMIYSQKWAKLK